MEATKLYIKPLNKTFSVRHTNKLMKMSYNFQLLMAKLGTIDQGDDPEEQVKLSMKYSQALTDFPMHALKLTDKQVEKLDDCEQDELQTIAVKLALTIQGLPKRDIDATINDMTTAMKHSTGEDAQKSEK